MTRSIRLSVPLLIRPLRALRERPWSQPARSITHLDERRGRSFEAAPSGEGSVRFGASVSLTSRSNRRTPNTILKFQRRPEFYLPQCINRREHNAVPRLLTRSDPQPSTNREKARDSRAASSIWASSASSLRSRQTLMSLPTPPPILTKGSMTTAPL
jgi:hypothetical protein